MSSDNRDELESALCLGDPGETVSLDVIKAMAQAVRDAGFAHQHRFVKGSYYQETSNGLRHMRWDETCRCGESNVRCLTMPVTEGEA